MPTNSMPDNVGTKKLQVFGLKGEKGDTGERGPQGIKGEKGDPFEIKKIYSSVNDMNADFSGTDVKVGQFVLVNTGSIEDADTAKLYVKTESAYTFVVDLSGMTGIQGPQGIQGIQGPKGDTGPQGVQGPKGDTGSTGPQGPKGDTGATGPQGINGEKGTRGNSVFSGVHIAPNLNPDGYHYLDSYQSLPGSPQIGDIYIQTANSSIGNVYEVVSILNNSDSWADANFELKGNIMGPQGIQGIQGPKGDNGEQGPQGPKGDIGLTGNRGPQGIQGIQGLPGDRGATILIGTCNVTPNPDGFYENIIEYPDLQIYDLFIETNKWTIYRCDMVSGSYNRWYILGNIKGDTGATGPQGPKGDTGATGPQGPKGDIGLTGNTGPQGIQGPKGDTGATGPQGPKGDTGATGPQGDMGLTGNPGVYYGSGAVPDWAQIHVDPDGEGTVLPIPNIGSNGNWYIGNEDTGKPSRGENGAAGTDLLNIEPWTFTLSDGTTVTKKVLLQS